MAVSMAVERATLPVTVKIVVVIEVIIVVVTVHISVGIAFLSLLSLFLRHSLRLLCIRNSVPTPGSLLAAYNPKKTTSKHRRNKSPVVFCPVPCRAVCVEM